MVLRRRLTTTFEALDNNKACVCGYKQLREGMGREFKFTQPFNLLHVLKYNGESDCIWALRATLEPCGQLARLLAADIAESVLHIYEAYLPEDNSVRAGIRAARYFATSGVAPTIEDVKGVLDAVYGIQGIRGRDTARYAARSARFAVGQEDPARTVWDTSIDACISSPTYETTKLRPFIERYLLPDEETA